MPVKPSNEALAQRVAQLEEDATRSRRLLETSGVGLYKIDLNDGRFLWVNESFAAMLGNTSAAQLIEKNLHLSHCTDVAQCEALRRHLHSRGQVEHFELDIRRCDGTVLQLEFNALACSDGASFEGTAIDISRHRHIPRTLQESGTKALELYLKHNDRIQLVILDMIMPEMSGDETFNRLRSINAAVKVLLSSGYSINEEASKILERGCNGSIQKPFNLIELSRKIREILDSPVELERRF